MSTEAPEALVTAAALARRARNVVAKTILAASLSPGRELPTATIGELIDLLQPLDALAHAEGTWSRN